jgi:hypothetical protein
MKFLYGNDEAEIVKDISYDSFPSDLESEGIWGYFAFVEDEKSDIKVMCAAYNNDNHSTGDVIISNKIYNEFPIAQSAWLMSCQINRMYVDPYYRNKNIAKYSVITNDMVAKHLGYTVWSKIYSDTGGTPAGDQLYNAIYDLGFENNYYKIDPNEIFDFRNYSFPVIYFDKRVVYVETNTK